VNLSDTIGVIEAKMGSQGLPGKILAPLSGRPALALLTDRIRSARVREWWLATTSDPADDVTESWGFELGLRVFRGNPGDPLSHFVAIGQETRADWLVRISADNPFLEAGLIDTLLAGRDDNKTAAKADLIQLRGGIALECEPDRKPEGIRGPVFTPQLPIGFGVEMARRDSLERADREIDSGDPTDRAHATRWLHSNARVLSVPTPLSWPHRPDWRWVIETYADLAMARSAFRVFADEATSIDYPTMVSRLDSHPEITGMNQQLEQKRLSAR
jgi:spore coat polysaccharide biosynthesis protein SpsF